MEEIIRQCLQELANESPRSNQDKAPEERLHMYFYYEGIDSVLVNLAAKLTAKGVQLPNYFSK